MSAFIRDLAYGVRIFRRNPGFNLLAVLIIALGIGATTAIFSLIDGVLLNPLPYRDPGRLTVLWSDFGRSAFPSRAFTAPGIFCEWRDRARSFTAMAAFRNTNRTFTALDQPVTPLTHEVTDNFFDVLGVRALRGRTFLPGEGMPGKDDVAMVSYALWRSTFGGSESLVGSRVEMDGRSVRIVGILPAGYRVPNNGITVPPELFVPTTFDTQLMERESRQVVVIGRLRPDVTLAQARAEMAGISSQIARESSASFTPPRAAVIAIRDDLTGDFRKPFLLLQIAVAIMLLIACANVTNLLLARYSSRGYEFTVRTAIGASRGQILRQLLAENLVLSGFGAVLGVLLAGWSLRPMLALVPAAAGLPFADQVHISPTALAFALTLSVLTAAIFGLAPAREASRLNTAQGLAESGRSRSVGRSGGRWRNALISCEIGLSLILLMAAGLMVRTFVNLSTASWGFDPAHVLTVRNSLRGEQYRAASVRRNYFINAAARLGEIAGVESVSAVSFPPPLAPVAPAPFVVSGQAPDPGNDPTASLLTVLPRYFETLHTPILSGRSITEADTADSAPVAVISQSVARRYFLKGDPVGQSVRFNFGDPRDWRVVGVVADARGQGLNAAAMPAIYLPNAQAPVQTMTFVIRTRTAPMEIANAAERTLWSLGKLMNVYQTLPLEERLSDSYWQSRFTMALLAVFAGLALALATIGVYGVMAYLAAQRTQEIGIRIAIGASPAHVVWLVTSQALRAAAIGLAGGLAASLSLSRLLAGQLFGVGAGDPVTLLAAAFVLMLVCAAACVGPALRAVRVDPLLAMRGN